MAGAHQAAGLHGGMRHQLALDRSGRNVLAFAGLELLLDAADDFHLAVGFELDNVAGAKETILGEGVAGALRVFVSSPACSWGS